jgi:hypothetical protein
MNQKSRVLFVCGSINQTQQLHAVARQMPEYEAWFTPFYVDRTLELWRKLGVLEATIAGKKLSERCFNYLEQHGLDVDYRGQRHRYDLAVTCTDLFIPNNLRSARIVAVQEGILDPPGVFMPLVRRFDWMPRWTAGTGATGMSGLYDKFCVASEGYKDHFVSLGAPRERLVVTGMPNFDNCDAYRNNDFPHHDYVLVCTSDARETLKKDNREAFVQRALAIAAGRQVIFKLHPNENIARAKAELARWAPHALVYASGSAEQMIANCSVYIGQYSSTVFVALALGKEVHSYHPAEELHALLPVQNKSAASNVAEVCRKLLQSEPAPSAPRSSWWPKAPLIPTRVGAQRAA